MDKLINLWQQIPWDITFLNVSVGEYSTFIAAFFLSLLVFKIFKNRAIHRLEKLSKKTKTDIDDKLIEVIKSLKPIFYIVLAAWIASQFVVVGGVVNKIINIALIAILVYQVSISLQILINFIAQKTIKQEQARENLVNIISTILKAILWIFGILLILSNLGVNVTSLLAGVAVGGVAIALAAQAILGDLFSSIIIYLDKPFEPGDFIILDPQTMGTVEKIGFKTTRIRALQGEEIVMANSDLTSKKIHNYKKMEERRIVFNLGVVYGTGSDKLKKIPEIIKGIIDKVGMATFDRAHFSKYGDFALLFEIVYYSNTPDYNVYMDLQQEINLKIKQEFEKEGIEMAFPTQTIHVQQGEKK